MKKSVAIFLLFVQITFMFKSFLPSFISYVNDYLWKVSYSENFKKLPPRINLLSQLNELSKHQEQKKAHPFNNFINSQPAVYLFSSIPAAFVSTVNCSMIFNFFNESKYTVYTKLDIPPPKIS
jgi:hypothetical protein